MHETGSPNLLGLPDSKMASVQFFGAVVGVVVVLLYFIRRYFRRGVFNSARRLDGKTVIITGANTGIGKETAVDLAARGARVIIACRDKSKGSLALQDIKERSNSQQVYLENLDLASFKSIRDFVDRIKKNESKLHILINNAGVLTRNFTLTKDGFETTFGVNHLGHFLLTNLLLDLLKKSAPSRIVNVSSKSHKRVKTLKLTREEINTKENYSGATAYRESKLANVLFTRELEKRLEGTLTGVTSYAVHPGTVHTELFRNQGWLVTIVIKILCHTILRTPKQGAQTTLYCSVAEELEGMSGRYYFDCAEEQLGDHAKDNETARKLWEVSVDFVGL